MSIETAGTGERFRVGHDEIAVRAAAAETEGALLALDVALPAGGGPPMLHRHAPAEIYRVLGGALAIYVAGERGAVRRVVADAGDVVNIPGGCEHTVRTESEAEAQAYVVFAPGTEMEAFMRSAGGLAAQGPPAIEDVLALAERHGIEITRLIPSIA